MAQRCVTRAYVLQDKQAVIQITQDAFGPEHKQRSVWNLRKAEPIDSLTLIAEDKSLLGENENAETQKIVGSLQFWPIKIGSYRSLLLGPLAIKYYLRGLGAGRLLVTQALSQIKNRDWEFCLVSGEPDYYPKFGFKPAPTNLEWPGPIERERVQFINLRSLDLEKLTDISLPVLSDVE